ncbi:MAG: hypothetical protein KGL39_57915 [Patescibacteria group bacterium]|nr:hypothetical protein [Patescibacteria group bacterium]
MNKFLNKYAAVVDFAPAFSEMKPLWADERKCKKSTPTAARENGEHPAPRTPPAEAWVYLPAYRHVTDERAWRPGEA